MSTIGSALMNRPLDASYSRAPTWVRPVLLSFLPEPRKARAPGQVVAIAPRWLPYGSNLRRVTGCPAFWSTATVAVLWWSVSRTVRTAGS